MAGFFGFEWEGGFFRREAFLFPCDTIVFGWRAIFFTAAFGRCDFFRECSFPVFGRADIFFFLLGI